MNNQSVPTWFRFRPCQSGVGLIEIMVSVLVLSIGFIGVAALQTTSLATNNQAMTNSMATVSIYSIADAMRIDRVAAKSGHYNGTIKADHCPGNGSLANNQLRLWCKQLASLFGAVDTTKGIIYCGVHGNCKITISYNHSAKGSSDKARTVVTEVKL